MENDLPGDSATLDSLEETFSSEDESCPPCLLELCQLWMHQEESPRQVEVFLLCGKLKKHLEYLVDFPSWRKMLIPSFISNNNQLSSKTNESRCSTSFSVYLVNELVLRDPMSTVSLSTIHCTQPLISFHLCLEKHLNGLIDSKRFLKIHW